MSLPRRTPLKRGGYLQRHTRLEPRSKDPARRRQQRQKNDRLMGDAGDDAGIGDFIRSRPCAACGFEYPRSVVAHILERTNGHGPLDRWGRPNILPLCWQCHSTQHTIGWRLFAQRWRIRPRRIAREHRRLWLLGQ